MLLIDDLWIDSPGKDRMRNERKIRQLNEFMSLLLLLFLTYYSYDVVVGSLFSCSVSCAPRCSAGDGCTCVSSLRHTVWLTQRGDASTTLARSVFTSSAVSGVFSSVELVRRRLAAAGAPPLSPPTRASERNHSVVPTCSQILHIQMWEFFFFFFFLPKSFK